VFWIKISDIFIDLISVSPMAFMRSGTEASMVSRAWSASEFLDGVAHLLDKKDEIPDLPDNLDDLEEHMG